MDDIPAMQTRSKTRQRQAAGPASTAPEAAPRAGVVAGDAGAARSPSITAATDGGGVSPLWPLSPGFPELAAQLVRSQLPAPALVALRRVCRAARDDFVDCCYTRARPSQALVLDAAAPFVVLAAAAPRLHRLEAIELPEARLGPREAAALADALAALPRGGAALRELFRLDAATNAVPQVERLAAALGTLQGLTRLELGVGACRGAAALVGGAGALTALRRLAISAHRTGGPAARWEQLKAALPLRRLQCLEALTLRCDAPDAWLPAMLEPNTAAALARLRDLELWLSPQFAQVGALEVDVAAAQLRGPWLPHLTRLELTGGRDGIYALATALPRGALPALLALSVSGVTSTRRDAGQQAVHAAALRALLSACGGAAALHSLSLACATPAALLAAAEAGLPALRALRYYGDELWARAGDGAWRALVRAPLARLTRLEIDTPAWLAEHPLDYAAELDALFSARWARSLQALTLRALPKAEGWGWLPLLDELDEAEDPQQQQQLLDAGAGPRGAAVLRALRGLSALASLRALRLEMEGLDAGALELAAAEGADGWAQHLTALELSEPRRLDAALPRALAAQTQFARLGRLVIDAHGALRGDGALAPADLGALSEAAAAALPRLARIEFVTEGSGPPDAAFIEWANGWLD